MRSRQLQALAFRFAADWFQIEAPEIVQETWAQFPREVTNWFREYSFAPLENLISPNKEVLWLHREFVEGKWAQRTLVLRGLLPAKVPRSGIALERLRFHTRALVSALFARASSRLSQTSD